MFFSWCVAAEMPVRGAIMLAEALIDVELSQLKREMQF